MKTWEYRKVYFHVNQTETPSDVEELNAMGKDGWELCHIWIREGQDGMAYLKREVPGQPEQARRILPHLHITDLEMKELMSRKLTTEEACVRLDRIAYCVDCRAVWLHFWKELGTAKPS